MAVGRLGVVVGVGLHSSVCFYLFFCAFFCAGDPKAILRKIKRAPREKKPVHRIGYDGHVNPWSVSDESPAWIEGHMKQYDTNAILSRSVKKVDRARRQFENSHTTASSQINDVINGATYHRNDTSAFNDSKWS